MTPKQHKEARCRLIAALERERRRQGLALADVMNRGGPTPACLIGFKKGRRGPNLLTFISFAEALGWHVRLVKDGRLLGDSAVAESGGESRLDGNIGEEKAERW